MPLTANQAAPIIVAVRTANNTLRLLDFFNSETPFRHCSGLLTVHVLLSGNFHFAYYLCHLFELVDDFLQGW